MLAQVVNVVCYRYYLRVCRAACSDSCAAPAVRVRWVTGARGQRFLQTRRWGYDAPPAAALIASAPRRPDPLAYAMRVSTVHTVQYSKC